MKIKRGLKNKREIIIASVISIIVMILVLEFACQKVIQDINLQTEENMAGLGEILARQIDGDRHQKFVEAGSSGDTFAREVDKLLLDTRNSFPEIINIYTIVQVGDSNVWKIVLTTDANVKSKISGRKKRDLVGSEIYKLYLGSVTGKDFVYREGDGLFSIYRCIHNSNGDQVAILGIDIGENKTAGLIKKILSKVQLFTVLVLLVLYFIGSRTIANILGEGQELAGQCREIKKGERLYLSEKAGTKLGFLVGELNQVLGKYKNKIDRQRELINRVTREKENIFQVYKDVIEAVTQGKILLLSREEFFEKISGDFCLYSTKLTGVEDITRCRQELDSILTTKKFAWWDGKNRRNILLCLSEAATNAIKHAGSGELLLSVKEQRLTLYILDNGRGIDLKKLPYSIFIKGFSTKQMSLGIGFLLMEKHMDKIILSTSKGGTFLALEKSMGGD